MAQYFVAISGAQKGPFSIEQIIHKLESRDLKPSDHIYDHTRAEWLMLSVFPETSEVCKRVMPTENVRSLNKKKELAQEEWFILKGDTKYGPFTLVDVVKMLQEKSLFEYDYVWKASMPSWKRIAEVPEYHPEHIKQLATTDDEEINQAFFRRRHKRAAYGASLIVHNNVRIWKGTSFEISQGGAGVVIEHTTLAPGDTLYVHFKPGDGVPPFNAVCEIVSKQFVTEPNVQNVKYGLKFTKVHFGVQKAIRDFAGKKEAA